MKEICTLLVKLYIICSRMQRVNLHARPSIIQVGCPTCCYQVCALDHESGVLQTWITIHSPVVVMMGYLSGVLWDLWEGSIRKLPGMLHDTNQTFWGGSGVTLLTTGWCHLLSYLINPDWNCCQLDLKEQTFSEDTTFFQGNAFENVVYKMATMMFRFHSVKWSFVSRQHHGFWSRRDRQQALGPQHVEGDDGDRDTCPLPRHPGPYCLETGPLSSYMCWDIEITSKVPVNDGDITLNIVISAHRPLVKPLIWDSTQPLSKPWLNYCK